MHRTADELGIRTNCTMLYGHVESYADRVAHLRRLRDLQDETAGFLTFIPLAYHLDENALGVALGRQGIATTASTICATGRQFREFRMGLALDLKNLLSQIDWTQDAHAS